MQQYLVRFGGELELLLTYKARGRPRESRIVTNNNIPAERFHQNYDLRDKQTTDLTSIVTRQEIKLINIIFNYIITTKKTKLEFENQYYFLKKVIPFES